MTLKGQDLEVLEALSENLCRLRHRLNTIDINERLLGNIIFNNMGDELHEIGAETLCAEWETHEYRVMRFQETEKYLSYHERRVATWLKRLRKKSSKTTTK
jgi:hypothetical protein